MVQIGAAKWYQYSCEIKSFSKSYNCFGHKDMTIPCYLFYCYMQQLQMTNLKY